VLNKKITRKLGSYGLDISLSGKMPPTTGETLRAWLLSALVVHGAVAGNPDAKRLYDDLLSNYNKLVRPVVNTSDVLRVCIKLKLSQLIDVVSDRLYFLLYHVSLEKERQGRVITVLFLYHKWAFGLNCGVQIFYLSDFYSLGNQTFNHWWVLRVANDYSTVHNSILEYYNT
jgi:Neurotransmitter-gated ion-channel ligand binding domain